MGSTINCRYDTWSIQISKKQHQVSQYFQPTNQQLDPFITRIMTGIHKLRPSSAKYQEIWDANQVFKYLSTIKVIPKYTYTALLKKTLVLSSLQRYHQIDNVFNPTTPVNHFNSLTKTRIPMSNIKKIVRNNFLDAQINAQKYYNPGLCDVIFVVGERSL
ncbi:hypothetical protein ACTFIR_007603 [Dictyostelium discoideum]